MGIKLGKKSSMKTSSQLPIGYQISYFTQVLNFIIKETRLVKNNNGRTSKQSRLYDYITSPERFRKIQKKIEYKEELKKLTRLQQEYNAEKWTKQIELIEKSLKV
jgi:hypothetical protein